MALACRVKYLKSIINQATKSIVVKQHTTNQAINIMDNDYLRREVGPVLAKALAEVSIVQPNDPVEYVATWLRNYVEARSRAELVGVVKRSVVNVFKEKKDMIQLAREKAEHTTFLHREKQKRQEEERLKQEEIKRQEELRKAGLKAQADGFRARKKEMENAFEALPEKERKAAPLGVWKSRVKAAVAELAALEPIFTQTRRKRELPQYTSGIIHLALYLLDMVEEKDDWAACRKVLRKEDFLKKVAEYEPLGRQKIKRAKKVAVKLSELSRSSLLDTSFLAYMIYEWLKACMDTRKAAHKYKTDNGVAEEEDHEIQSDEEEELEEQIDRLVRAKIEAEEEAAAAAAAEAAAAQAAAQAAAEAAEAEAAQAAAQAAPADTAAAEEEEEEGDGAEEDVKEPKAKP